MNTTCKTLLLQLEVGMRFNKSFHNESSLRCCVVQILSVGNLSELFERNVARTWIMVIKRLGIESLWFQGGNVTVLVMQTCLVKAAWFTFTNQDGLNSSFIITIRKTSSVKDLNNPEIHKNHKNDINPPHTKISSLARYI